MRNLNTSSNFSGSLRKTLEKLKITFSASCFSLHSVRSLLNFFCLIESGAFKISLLLRKMAEMWVKLI